MGAGDPGTPVSLSVISRAGQEDSIVQHVYTVRNASRSVVAQLQQMAGALRFPVLFACQGKFRNLNHTHFRSKVE